MRLATLLMALLLIAMVYGVSLMDGLTQRDIRRARGGRESANLYHRAKHLQLALLATSAAVSLLSPVSIDPRTISLSTATLVTILVRIQWSYYKKHL